VPLLVLHRLDGVEAQHPLLRTSTLLAAAVLMRRADVEGTHGELRAGFADRLRAMTPTASPIRDRPTARQIQSVAVRATP